MVVLLVAWVDGLRCRNPDHPDRARSSSTHGGRAQYAAGAVPALASEPVNESHGRGAPRLCRGASERLGGGVGGHVWAPHSVGDDDPRGIGGPDEVDAA